ncbi:MAG: hypothetical protein ACOX3T_00550 [Bdellovibrionota bacterium]
MIKMRISKSNRLHNLLFNKQKASRLKICLLFCICFLTLGGKAWGDLIVKEKEGDSLDPLKEYRDISNSLYVTSGTGGAAGGRGGAQAGPVSNSLTGANSGVIPGEELQESKITEGESLKVQQGRKLSNFHTYIPKKQFERMVDSKEWEKIYDQSIKDNYEGMIGATTWGLANSAVGQARFNAILQAQSALSNHYMSELAFIKQVEQNPYMRQSISDAYFSCVRKKMNDSMNDQGKRYTWFEAQEICMGDESSLGTVMTVGGLDNMTPNLFDYSSVIDNKNGLKDKICLSDYLFNQEEKSESGSDMGKLKESYQKLLGDIEFKIKEGNSPSSNEPIGMRSIEYKFYYPGESSEECGMKSTQSPSELYLETLLHRYNALVIELGTFCQKVKREAEGIDEFIEREEYARLQEYYKVGGYIVDIQTIDNLYKLANDTAKVADDGKADCSVFSELFLSDSEELLSFGKDESSRGGGTTNKSSRLYKSILYKIAKGVTDITILRLYNVFYTYLQNTTTGTFGVNSEIYSLVEKQYEQILYMVLGVHNTYAPQFIFNKLKEFENINLKVNELINAQAQSFTDMRRQGEDAITQNEDFAAPNK